MLHLPKPYERSLELIWSTVQRAIPTPGELASIRLRGRRILLLIENILTEHERLTQEARYTLKAVRRSLQLLSLLTTSLAIYIYVKRFHSSLFQTYWYLAISSRKSAILLAVVIILLTSYVVPTKEVFLKSLTSIA